MQYKTRYTVRDCDGDLVDNFASFEEARECAATAARNEPSYMPYEITEEKVLGRYLSSVVPCRTLATYMRENR